MPEKTPRIGTERESSLHRALKFRYTGSEDRTETPVEGYVCDGVSDTGELIEVQTGSFGPLKQKARVLAKQNTLRIIHPIIVTKYIELMDEQGALLRRRKSPRKGSPWDLFKALLYAPELPLIPGVTIELALVDMLERRVDDGRGSWRRRGVSIDDKSLTAYHGSIPLVTLGDYVRFIPFSRGEEFTVRLLGEKARIDRAVAGKTLYVLTKLQVAERLRRDGNAWVYRLGKV